ncbi:MAG TPA: FkbM family methyltransferase [Acidimicrobiales bacterium]|jgi:FkbM family methyltransferase|nr:FkbM family methyltransferase [Acidimicrobiales bacterium]
MEQRVAAGVNRVAGQVRRRIPTDGRLHRGLRRVRRVLPQERPAIDHPFSQVIYEFGRGCRDAAFVQVGANDGEQRDPLRHEIQTTSWHGLMIEPVPYVFDRLRRNYGGHDRITLVNAAVADEDGSRTLYYLPESDDDGLPQWYDALASFREDVLRKHVEFIPDIDERIASMDVPCRTFDSLCAEHALATVDVIQIDTEGFDWEVIKLIDLDRYRPTLLMFEHYHLSDDDKTASWRHLRAHGYEVYTDVMDALCLRVAPVGGASKRVRKVWREIGGDHRVEVP